MTTVCWDGQTLAADRRTVNHGSKHGTVTKIHSIRGSLCAITGAFDIGLELLDWYRNGAVPEDYPQLQVDTNECSLWVITPDRRITAYSRSPVPMVFEQQHMAAGSGRDFALAAMFLGQSAEDAVRVACAFDVDSGNGIDTLSFD